jgi:sn1-specific diacylglycerol lipase
MRKTLEANMQSTILFPPGHVLWAMRDEDLHISHQRYRNSHSLGSSSGKRLRVFEVIDAEKVFSQIVFARNMLT